MSGTSDRFQFSNRRIPCPSCGSKRSFRSVADNSESGKCHACGIFIGTTATTSNYNDGIITTRGGRVLNVDKNAHTTSNNNSKNTEPSHRDVLRSLLPLVHARKRASCPKRPGLPECPGVPECDAFDELAAKLEYESGLSRIEAETQAAKELGYFSDHPNTSMIKIIEEALSLLRRESAFVALLTELTRPTILSEWRVGLTNDGAVLFWYEDQNGRFRNAKKIWYDPNGWNRLRDKRRPPHFLYKGNPVPLYGEWQLTPTEHRPFALFESEKTAIVASVHLPQYVCLAVGGHELKSEQKARVLRGRTGIILFDREPQTLRAAEEAARTIRTIGASVAVENLESFYPGIPDDWDAADIIYHQYQQWQQKQ